jgi:hypothetical protein
VADEHALSGDTFAMAEAILAVAICGFTNKLDRQLAPEEAAAITSALLTVKARRDLLKSQYDRMRNVLDQVEQRIHGHYDFALRDFIEAEAPPRRKSVDTLCGRLGMRKSKDLLKIVDPDACIRWCWSNLPSAVKVSERVVKEPLMAHLEKTGEIPDGCELIKNRPDAVYVKGDSNASGDGPVG